MPNGSRPVDPVSGQPFRAGLFPCPLMSPLLARSEPAELLAEFDELMLPRVEDREYE